MDRLQERCSQAREKGCSQRSLIAWVLGKVKRQQMEGISHRIRRSRAVPGNISARHKPHK